MLCVACGAETSGVPCGVCGEEPRLDGRYALLRPYAVCTFGQGWEARRESDGLRVAARVLQLARSPSEQLVDEFIAEMEILRRLRHQSIPRYLEGFEAAVQGRPALVVVHTWIEGHALRDDLTPWSEAEALELVAELLPILAYLHGLSPPVVHRDVCLGFLFRDADGCLILTGFGTTAGLLAEAHAAGMAVTSTGHLAPERFTGQATPATDLYGVGTVLASLLTGKLPRDLAGPRGRLEWRRHVHVSPAATLLLEQLLERDPARRLSGTGPALAMVLAAQAGGEVQTQLEAQARENAGVLPDATPPMAPIRSGHPTPARVGWRPQHEEAEAAPPAPRRRMVGLWVAVGLGALLLLVSLLAVAVRLGVRLLEALPT